MFPITVAKGVNCSSSRVKTQCTSAYSTLKKTPTLPPSNIFPVSKIKPYSSILTHHTFLHCIPL